MSTIQAVSQPEFIRHTRGGNRAYLAQQRSEILAIAEYGEGGRQGFVVIPEGLKGLGWERLVGELHKASALVFLSTWMGEMVLLRF